jgi:hypothetical protein
VIAGGVSAPCTAGLSDESAGGLAVVAERVRDDRAGQFEESLPDGGAAGSGYPDLVQERGQVTRAGRLARPAAGEEPAGCRVGSGVHVVAVR